MDESFTPLCARDSFKKLRNNKIAKIKTLIAGIEFRQIKHLSFICFGYSKSVLKQT